MHEDGARVHGKVQEGDRAEAITVHGDGARVHAKVQGTGQRAITVHGDGARVYAEGQGGDRGRARQRCTGTVYTGEGDRGRAR